MKHSYATLLALAILGLTMAEVTPSPIPSASTYSQPDQPSYVPHTTYPQSATYNDGYVIPVGTLPYDQSIDTAITTPPTVGQIALQVMTKVGQYVLGGVAVLFAGALFTTAICSLTPICNITFAGFRDVNKETMRTFVTPDNILSAASFVEDAVGKYNRLQRSAAKGF